LASILNLDIFLDDFDGIAIEIDPIKSKAAVTIIKYSIN